jgi:hypothetical protein
MSQFETMSNAELRNKLLEYGFDVPTTVSKNLMLKQLDKCTKEGRVKSGPGSAAGKVTSSSSGGRTVNKASTRGRRASVVAPRRRSPTPASDDPQQQQSSGEDDGDGGGMREIEQKQTEPKRKRAMLTQNARGGSGRSQLDEVDGRMRGNDGASSNAVRPLTRASVGRGMWKLTGNSGIHA